MPDKAATSRGADQLASFPAGTIRYRNRDDRRRAKGTLSAAARHVIAQVLRKNQFLAPRCLEWQVGAMGDPQVRISPLCADDSQSAVKSVSVGQRVSRERSAASDAIER